ncbi:GNAT family acetyltransferase [Legionella quateirensis]|uniref:GNAT family acetyltransferase n=2 Tax=Legionella quateirensis TaxID=45072 RepID=A0A378KQS6_9GAMM|nr:GNAT family acetyltransferase [Legionella quateirensis]STY16509.1 GNAT family acetyltransferase [Legionella quateirensis]
MNRTMLNDPLVLKNLIGQTIHLELLDNLHYESLRIAANDERIWTFMPMKAHDEYFDDWFNESLIKHNTGLQITYVIRCISDGQVVGCRSYYDIDVQHKRLEVGYGWFSPNVWGRKISLECMWLLFRQAIEDWRFNRIQIATDPNNERSYNNLKKLGAREEGVLREHMIHHNGAITDTVIFSILSSEWPQINEGILKRLTW